MENNRAALENACREFEADLVLYYYGESAEAERRRVEGHVNGCERCKNFLADLGGLLPQMATTVELPATFWNDYYREMVQKLAHERERKPWWRSLIPSFSGWAVPAFGTAMMVVLAIGLIFGQADWNSPSNEAGQEIVPQEILSDTGRLEFFKSLDLLESLNALEKMDGVRAEQEIRSV